MKGIRLKLGEYAYCVALPNYTAFTPVTSTEDTENCHSSREPACVGGAPGGDDETTFTTQSRRRRGEQRSSTIPALFLRGGGAASMLPGRTPTQHTEDGATTPTFFVSAWE